MSRVTGDRPYWGGAWINLTRGRILDVQGERERAVVAYRRVLDYRRPRGSERAAELAKLALKEPSAFSSPKRQPLRALYGWYFSRVLPRIGQCLSKSRYNAYNYLPVSVGEFPSGEALAERMRACGLKDIRQHPLTLGIATMYVGTK